MFTTVNESLVCDPSSESCWVELSCEFLDFRSLKFGLFSIVDFGTLVSRVEDQNTRPSWILPFHSPARSRFRRMPRRGFSPKEDLFQRV